jgi:anhydro-N-acetylmuramic acid kinase
MAAMTGIGLMSGTSGDGVDSAVVKFSEGEKPELIASDFLRFSKKTRGDIAAASRPDGRADLICRLNVELGRIFGKAAVRLCKKAKLPLKKIDFIGSHGQTIRHQPSAKKSVPSSTLQIGEAAEIAQMTGAVVVSDFRPADVAAGGSGAPLAPLAHHLLFASTEENRIIHNLGGISNVTFLPKGGGPGRVTGFDTGPANSLLDLAVLHFSKGRIAYDPGGGTALKGDVDNRLFKFCMAHPYYKRKPPKSSGKETFGSDYFRELLKRYGKIPVENFLRTLAAVTAESAVRQTLKFFNPKGKLHWIVCGGGAKNRAVLKEINFRLNRRGELSGSSRLGIGEKSVEAVICALLAHRTLKGRPGNLPGVTGAKRPVVVGKVTYLGKGKRI